MYADDEKTKQDKDRKESAGKQKLYTLQQTEAQFAALGAFLACLAGLHKPISAGACFDAPSPPRVPRHSVNRRDRADVYIN